MADISADALRSSTKRTYGIGNTKVNLAIVSIRFSRHEMGDPTLRV